MKMTKLMAVTVMVLATSAMLVSCKLGCKKAYRYQNALNALELRLGDAAQNPASITTTCNYLSEEGFRLLEKASGFAERAAYNKFYWSETKCTQGFWRQRCEYYGPYPRPYPRPYPPYGGGYPYYRCYDYYECTRYETIEHKLDGYDDAMFVATELQNSATQLNFACTKAKEGQSAVAAAQMMATKSMMSGPIKDKSTLTLGKAGCYTRPTNGVADTNEE